MSDESGLKPIGQCQIKTVIGGMTQLDGIASARSFNTLDGTN